MEFLKDNRNKDSSKRINGTIGFAVSQVVFVYLVTFGELSETIIEIMWSSNMMYSVILLGSGIFEIMAIKKK